MLRQSPNTLKIPSKLDYSDDAIYGDDQPHAGHNRACDLVFAYASARGIMPYDVPTNDIIAAIRADLDSLNR